MNRMNDSPQKGGVIGAFHNEPVTSMSQCLTTGKSITESEKEHNLSRVSFQYPLPIVLW